MLQLELPPMTSLAAPMMHALVAALAIGNAISTSDSGRYIRG